MRSPIAMFAVILLVALLLGGLFYAGYSAMTPPPSPPAPAPEPEIVVLAAASEPGPRLVIKRAVYGDLPDGASTDVTEKVVALVTHDSLSIAATNDNFGDSAPNIVKKLRVDYLLDGQPRTRMVSEDETLKISAAKSPSRLVVKKAVYGDLPDGPSTDITEKVASSFDGDALSIAATNENFGDSAPGIVKKLRVDYTLDGKTGTKTVDEGETLKVAGTE